MARVFRDVNLSQPPIQLYYLHHVRTDEPPVNHINVATIAIFTANAIQLSIG